MGLLLMAWPAGGGSLDGRSARSRPVLADTYRGYWALERLSCAERARDGAMCRGHHGHAQLSRQPRRRTVLGVRSATDNTARSARPAVWSSVRVRRARRTEIGRAHV